MAKARKFGAAQVDVSIRDRVGAGLKAIEKKMQGFATGLNTIGSRLTGLGAGVTAAFGGLAGVLAFPTMLAANLEQTTVAFETMLGSADKANVLLGQLRDFAASTPLSFDELTDAAKKLLAFGVAADQVETELRRVGDIAMGIGAPIGEIAEIYGKAKVQGRLFAEDINQLTGRGIPVIQQLAKQFNIAESEVKKLVESGAVNFGHLQQSFIDLTSEGSQFGGMMAKQANTLGGLFSTLKDNVMTALIPIGQAVAEVVTPITQAMIAMMKPISALIANNAHFAKALAVIAGVGTIAGVAIMGIGSAVVALGIAASAAATVFSVMASIIGAISLPLIGIVAVLGAGAVAFGVIAYESGLAGEAFEWLKSVFSSLLTTAKNTFGGIIDALAAGQFQLAAQILWAGLKVAFLQGADGVLAAVDWLWKNVWKVTDSFYMAYLRRVYEVFRQIPKIIVAAYTWNASIMTSVMAKLAKGSTFELGKVLDNQLAQARSDLESLTDRAEQFRKQAEQSARKRKPHRKQAVLNESNTTPSSPPATLAPSNATAPTPVGPQALTPEQLMAMTPEQRALAMQREQQRHFGMPETPVQDFETEDPRLLAMQAEVDRLNAELAQAKHEAEAEKKLQAAQMAASVDSMSRSAGAQVAKNTAIGTSSAAAVAAGVFGSSGNPNRKVEENTARTNMLLQKIALKPTVGFGQ